MYYSIICTDASYSKKLGYYYLSSTLALVVDSASRRAHAMVLKHRTPYASSGPDLTERRNGNPF
jgi:hypothetical protein